VGEIVLITPGTVKLLVGDATDITRDEDVVGKGVKAVNKGFIGVIKFSTTGLGGNAVLICFGAFVDNTGLILEVDAVCIKIAAVLGFCGKGRGGDGVNFNFWIKLVELAEDDVEFLDNLLDSGVETKLYSAELEEITFALRFAKLTVFDSTIAAVAALIFDSTIAAAAALLVSDDAGLLNTRLVPKGGDTESFISTEAAAKLI
jgi:hypothetical protein